ncbi:MAG TPA: hypothetical protein VMB53_02880 [Gaiellaceae bacterium]|nr:hypothetical protein [Gaiellaceae bacterium]
MEPAVEPVAVVVTEAVCVAPTVSAPPTDVAPPVPTAAVVVTFESEIASDGATETPPPEAPDFDVVVIESVEEA